MRVGGSWIQSPSELTPWGIFFCKAITSSTAELRVLLDQWEYWGHTQPSHVNFTVASLDGLALINCPRGFTFTWWGCCGLCLWHKPDELAHPFLFCSLSVSAFMALSTVFHSINSPDDSPLSHSVLPVLFLPYWSFLLYTSLWKSLSALI